MTDDQKPFDDDLSFDDVPVVPKDSRALDEGDDFLDEVEDSLEGADLLADEQPGAEEVAGFAVHRGGAEVFGGGRPAEDDVSGVLPTASENGSEADDVLDLPASDAAWIDDPETEEPGIGGDASAGVDGPHDPRVGSPAEGLASEETDAGPESGDVDTESFDDVFVIEFGETDADDGEPAEDAEDLLLTPMAAVDPSAFDDEAADASTAFREDHAGWLGEDLPLDAFVGERVMSLDESLPLFEDDAATDEDPFAIDEVELEVEGADEAEEGDDSFLDAPAPETVQGVNEDAWAPLADGESWVLGAELGAGASFSDDVDAEHMDEAVELTDADEDGVLAPVFGMGRFDPSLEDGRPTDAAFQGFAADDEDAEDGETEYVDPIYGDVGAGIDEVEPQPYDERAEDEADGFEDGEFGDEFDDTFVDQEPSHGRVIGVFRGAGRSPWARVAAALLVSIGAAGATVATMRPEWLGLVPGAVTPERVAVARPEIRIEPVAPVREVIEQTATPSDVDAPAVEPVAPVVEPVVAVAAPVVEPTVPPAVPMVETAPVNPAGVAAGPEAPSVLRPRPAAAFVGFETRDGMEILDLNEPVPSRVAGVQVVSPGERAFAQLRNAEIFVGVVKRVEAAFVTLDLEPGEVSLSRSALTTLTPLASTDATEMLAAQHGYVRLPSEARLWGQILRNSTNDDVILQTEDARIRVPRGSVVQLQGADPARTALVDAQDDSWLDARIREQLRVGGDEAPTRSDRRR